MTDKEAASAGFFRASATPLAVLDAQATFQEMNGAWRDLVSAEPTSLVGQAFTAILKPDDATRARDLVARLAPGASEALDARLTASATGSIERLVRFHFTRDRENSVIYLTVIASPSQRAEDALRLSLLEKVLATAPVSVWAIDRQGFFTQVEGRATAVPPEHMLGKNGLDLFKGSEVETFLKRALAGEEFRTEVTAPGAAMGDPNVENYYFDAWYLPIRDSAGEVDGVIGFAIDVTSARLVENALREKVALIEKQNVTLNMFDRVLQSASMVLWAMDKNGVCTMQEGKGLELLGMKGGALVGLNLFDVFKDNEETAQILVRSLAGEETRSVSNAAAGVYMEGWNMPLRHRPDGEVEGVIGFAMDCTERVKNEIELREKLALIERQSATIRALATPIIEVWDEILCLPVIGTVDSARTADMMQGLLEAIVRGQARFAIVDLTGVEVVDTSTADHLIQLFRAAKVLGVDGVLCGIRPAVAQTVVALGLDLTQVRTMRSLRDALRWCIRARSSAELTQLPLKIERTARSSRSESNRGDR